MSIHRTAARRDKNEPEIVAALEAVGASVIKLSGRGVPDIACYFRSQWFLMDVKMPKGRLTEDQDWAETISPDAVAIVRSAEQALEAIGA